jgi:polyhydroxyalkanoate synthesis regulator phasin
MMVLEIIRKGLYAGLGVVVVTGEEIRKTLNRFVEAGKMTVEDSEALFSELSAKGEKQQDEFQQWLGEQVRGVVDRLDFVHRREVEALAAKIKNLEERLALLEDLRHTQRKTT